MLVGFHVEGWDYLILRAYLAKLLNLQEDEITPDVVGGSGRGLDFVEQLIPKALKRFYAKCAQFAVIGMDNDGSRDLLADGLSEDPEYPRHWVHSVESEYNDKCRWCRVYQRVAMVRPELNWLPKKPGSQWPIVVVVPVEAIEAWLLISRAIVDPGQGSLHAENELRRNQKLQFYGRPAATQDSVETIAVPMIRAMQNDQLGRLKQHSSSFRQFAEQIDEHRDRIVTELDCW